MPDKPGNTHAMKTSRVATSDQASVAPDLDILSEEVTLHPSGYVESPTEGDDGHERNLVKHMASFRSNPLEFLKEVSMHVSGSGWRAYDDYVGQPIFYPGFTDHMVSQVLSAPLLQARIHGLACQRVDLEEKLGVCSEDPVERSRNRERRIASIETNLHEVSEKITKEMICKMENKPFLRGAYYIATQLLTRAYHQGRLVLR